MTAKQRIVTISGTSRPGNYTSKALAVVNDELSARGAELVTFDAISLALAFPGLPVTDDGERLRAAVADATGVVIATPEYHGTFAAMTKLIIENLGFPSALKGKPVALLGVASGRIGAIKSLEHLRGVCAHLGALVLPTTVSIAGVRKVFDPDGRCLEKGAEELLRNLAGSLLDFIHDYICPRYELEAVVRDESAAPWAASV